MPPWIFGTTVFTCVPTLRVLPGHEHLEVRKSNKVQAADLSRIQKDEEVLRLALDLLAIEDDSQDAELATYSYPQELIEAYSGIAFFIGSPKLFCLVEDRDIPGEQRLVGDKEVNVRRVRLNEKDLLLAKLDDIAEIKVGLQTGDNRYYLRKSPGARGAYRIIDPKQVLSEDEIGRLSDEEKRDGVDPARHGGRQFLPYDKGGESLAKEGWLPNYWVPTQYYIDWSASAVGRLRSAAALPSGASRKAYIRNEEFYFRPGLTYSRTGVYAPTFRLSSGTVFDTEGCCLFTDLIPLGALLGLLCSNVVRYLLKVYIDHSVHVQVDDLKEVPIPLLDDGEWRALDALVGEIISAQKRKTDHAKVLALQAKVDDLVCEYYGLGSEDVAEVEVWYLRRYPTLAKAQSTLLREAR